MLLLVLILVLIAFSLLVVALLSGSVLWAWVSVGVSVAAAAVLLIDYLQRRSAVQAGAEVGAEAGPGRAATADVEPVTEVLPVIPRSGAVSGGDEAADSSRHDDSAAFDQAGFDQEVDGQQTVMLPVVQPSASAERPSGASPGTTSSSGDSSPTVTAAGSGRSPSDSRPGETEDASDAPIGGSGTAAAGALESRSLPPESRVTETETDDEPGSSGAADATVVVKSPGSTAGSTAGSGTGGKAGPPASGEVPVPAHEPAAPIAQGTPTAEGTPGAPEADTADAAGAPVTGDAPADTSADTDGDPPEEALDPAAAAVVARLDTEVLVIDEQPRYHVTGCRALVGKALIPIPAREAVDLGFTPCGWCTPDRTLAGRQTAAH